MAPHQVPADDVGNVGTVPVKPVAAMPGQSLQIKQSTPPEKRTWLMGTDAFNARMPHHDGIKALWETKWRFPCTKSVYPFHDGAFEDFAPIFDSLIARDINDGNSPQYTETFFPTAKKLEEAGDAAVTAGEKDRASELYLRAACVLRIARFPYVSAHVSSREDPAKWRAWEWQKAVYMKAAGRLWGSSNVLEVDVPHVFAQENDLGRSIPVYVRMPPPPPPPPPLVSSASASASPLPSGPAACGGGDGDITSRGCPVVILLTGLDGYRPDNTVRCNEFLSRGWAAVVVEIPGTADCPADPADPVAPDRLWDSLFAWMRDYTHPVIATDPENKDSRQQQQYQRFDMSRVLCWGLSAGGYYAVRIAHTHGAGHLAGVVAQGAGVHHQFDKEWIEKAEGHEYPFKLAPAFAKKFGYGDDVEMYKRDVQRRFSLLESGVLMMMDGGDCDGLGKGDRGKKKKKKGAARLLLVNGTKDGLMPIEDSMLLFEHGRPKEARFFPGALHMGYPLANSAVYPWMEEVLAGVQDGV